MVSATFGRAYLGDIKLLLIVQLSLEFWIYILKCGLIAGSTLPKYTPSEKIFLFTINYSLMGLLPFKLPVQTSLVLI